MPLAPTPVSIRLLRWFYTYLSPAVPTLAVQLLWETFSPPRRPLEPPHRAFLTSALPLPELLHFTVPAEETIRLRGYEWGAGERTVLLVHGWGGNAVNFRALVPRLVASGFRVVALDLPAHGQSEGWQTNLLDFREALRTLLQHIGWPYAVVAHSLGGLATSLLLAEPGKPEVAKFAFVASPIKGESAFETGFDQLHVAPAVRRRFYQRFYRWLGQELDYFAFAPRPALRARRVLALYDTEDVMVRPEEVRAYLAAHPDIETGYTAGVGHYRMFRNEAVLDRLVAFLTS